MAERAFGHSKSGKPITDAMIEHLQMELSAATNPANGAVVPKALAGHPLGTRPRWRNPCAWSRPFGMQPLDGHSPMAHGLRGNSPSAAQVPSKGVARAGTRPRFSGHDHYERPG
jgi:hypothetical protein